MGHADVRCFLLTPTDRYRVELRRFARGPRTCAAGPCAHDTTVVIAIETHAAQPLTGDDPVRYPPDDPRWPSRCACGYEYQPDDARQVWYEELYTRSDGAPECTRGDAPPGAMWYAPWYEDHHKGPDGHCLVVKLPGGHEWIVDGRASNCTLPKDNAHKCWVRHGTPPAVHVDKNGPTCGAGAGSILVPGYHGFLRHGVLVSC
jgi:hypothetical protein